MEIAMCSSHPAHTRCVYTPELTSSLGNDLPDSCADLTVFITGDEALRPRNEKCLLNIWSCFSFNRYVMNKTQ